MRDSVLEAWLKKEGYTFDYVPEVLIKDIVVMKEDLENIRLDQPLDQDHVLQMGIGLENGAELPALLLVPWKGKYRVGNGLHRRSALELAKREKVDAYLVRTSDEVIIEVLQRTSNVPNGKALGPDERILHALRLVKLDHSMKDAARMMGVGYSRVKTHKEQMDVEARAGKLGIDPSKLSITPKTLADMLAIPRDKHFSRAVELAHQCRLTSEEVRALVGQIRGAADDGSADELLNRFERENKDRIMQSRAGSVRPPGSRIRRVSLYFAQAMKILRSPEDAGLLALTRKEVMSLVKTLGGLVKQLQGRIEYLQRFLASKSKSKRKIA